MAVFSMLAVALLYRGTSAQCTGAYVFGIPVAPLDVCLTSSVGGAATSVMYSCEGDTGSIMNYAAADCAGEGTADTISAGFYTFVCAGESCDYGVGRTYVNDSTGACTADYAEAGIFMGNCLDLSAAGGSGSTQYTCSGTSANAALYLSTDCSGDAVTTQSITDQPCVELLSCNSDGSGDDTTDDTDDDTTDDTDDDTTDDTDDTTDDTDDSEEPTEEPQECEGYFVLNQPLSPLDVCVNNVTSAGVTTSSQYTCDGDVGMAMMYDAADCAGEGTSRPLESLFERIVCEGLTCDYAVSKDFQGEEGDCGTAYEEFAVFTDRCIAVPDDNFQSFLATCSGSDGVLTYYVANDCTGTVAETDDTSENPCNTIEACNTFGGGSSSASLPAALLAMVVSAIALIA